MQTTEITMHGERRPNRRLLHYYVMQAAMTGPGFVFMMPYMYFRYRTLRYSFDAEGLTVRWGLLFRREITLTYARIQDIHLVSNLVERWLGLGRVQIQTASGSASAEITIEGLPDFEHVRDELYSRMRGARGPALHPQVARGDMAALPAGDSQEIVTALQAATNELRALRAEIAASRQ